MENISNIKNVATLKKLYIEKQEQSKKILAEITEIENQITNLKQLKPEQYLAIILHEKYCRLDHDTYCDWYINGGDETIKHDRNSISYDTYLNYARELLELFKKYMDSSWTDIILDIMKIFEKIKNENK